VMTAQGFADDVGEEPGCRLVRLARPYADRRQANADAVEEALARIIGNQKLADGLLRAVTGERGVEEFVADGIRKGCAEHRNRRGEHQPRLVAVADGTDRIDQMPGAVEIDPVAL